MRPFPKLHRPALHALGAALSAVALAGCGGGDDEATASASSATLTCENKQFAAGTAVSVPTSAELATFAKTYTAAANTVTLSGSGGLTVNGKAITVASTCLVKESAGDMLMLSWGTANTVGAGAIVYDSHIDFRAGGISGVADGTIL
ncbi:MAG: hypothetical protein JNL87_20670 [Burkholderiaceae bacterium]|nr:hypothetical protein [Burkholderiaceae bacterium]